MSDFNDEKLRWVCKAFSINMDSKENITTGLINNTYKVTDDNGKSYILQEISPIFSDVDRLMNNIDKVTKHIKEKTKQEGGNEDRCTLNLLQSVHNKPYVSYTDEEGNMHSFRIFEFIENASTYDVADEYKLFQAGKGFGKFQRDLEDFPANDLFESIPDFHNILNRFTTCMIAINNATKTKGESFIREVAPEIQFVMENSTLANNSLQKYQLPLRVVHNDTKLNNVMLDDETQEAVCVIDLDTVMPGTILSDYGDAIRYCANTGREDDDDLENIGIDWGKLTAFTDGYMSQIAKSLTKEELELLPSAPMYLSYELGLRFFTDYLTGNKYFRCDKPNHNLIRTRAQFRLTDEFNKNLDKIRQIINNSYNKYLNSDLEIEK